MWLCACEHLLLLLFCFYRILFYENRTMHTQVGMWWADELYQCQASKCFDHHVTFHWIERAFCWWPLPLYLYQWIRSPDSWMWFHLYIIHNRLWLCVSRCQYALNVHRNANDLFVCAGQVAGKIHNCVRAVWSIIRLIYFSLVSSIRSERDSSHVPHSQL